MTITIEVKKNQNENNTSVLRRFTKKVQESGNIRKVKSIRYATRPKSKLALKTKALKRISKLKDIEKMKKMGKM